MNTHTRKQITFFKSYYDIAKLIRSDKARLEWYEVIMKIQFLEVHIDDVVIKNKELEILFISIKHSLRSSIDGYCARMGLAYKALFLGAYEGGSEGGYEGGSEQVEEEVQEEEEGEGRSMSSAKASDSTLKIANYLYDKIKQHKPNFKKPNLISWSKDIDKAIRLDNRNEDELLNAIDWIYTKDGEFWQPNILSCKKLRDKFDALEAQATRRSK